MFLQNRKRINLTIKEKNGLSSMLRKIKKMSRVKIGLDFSTKFNPSITLKIEKNPPSHFCYFFRARKQRNKNEKRNKNECNKNEWGQYYGGRFKSVYLYLVDMV